jgi:iron complex outermembrane receptor protein
MDTCKSPASTCASFNRVDSEGAIQSAIVNEKLAFRVAYTYAHDDGAIKEVAPSSAPWLAGEDLEQTAYWALRASLLFRLSDKVDSLLRYNHYETKGRNTPSYQGTDIDYGAVGFPVFDSIPGAHRQGLGFFENQNDFIGHRRLINDGFNNQITWKITPNITLLSLTTFDWGKWNEAIDGDGAPVNVTNNDRADTSNTNQFVQEFRLTGTTEKTNWVLGAFYGHDHVNVFQQYPYFEDPRCGAACDFGIGGGGIGEVTSGLG